MTRKVIEAGTAETVGLRAKHESAGPAQQDAPNPMADLRLAYARIIDPDANLASWRQINRSMWEGRWNEALRKADAILALKSTHLIGLSQGEGDKAQVSHAEGDTSVYSAAAEKMGWRWSDAHGGYIHDEHLEDGQHPSELTAEDACFLWGVETLDQAWIVVTRDIPTWTK